MNLCGCVIVAPDDRAPFVDQAIEDLVEVTGGRLSATVAGSAVTVLVGRQSVRSADLGVPEGLSEQGFVLRTIRSGDSGLIVCCGGGPHGDMYALIEMIKSIEKTADGPVVGDLDIREEPAFRRRGMYAHQHWAYKYPYSLRTWQFDDWKRYVDLLAYMKFNLLQIWSMVGILPDPLSEGDRAYLENYERVIDYAKNRRGFQVFIGECANNVAESDGGRPVQERHYFDVEVLKDPSDPKQLQDIVDNRRNMYEIAADADGYWIIDSDPGGFKGSPVSEFVDILIANRRLIDECTCRGPSSPLIYWMWQGWGKGIPLADRVEKTREALSEIQERLPEPWMVLACSDKHLEYVRELGCQDRAIFFPYGTVEIESSQPMTRLKFNEIHRRLSMIGQYGIKDVLGNAQTPLVQLPNIYALSEMLWHGVPEECPDYASYTDGLARLISPEIAQELSASWLAMDTQDAPAIASATVCRDVEPLAGPLGRFLFPDIKTVLNDLCLQLAVRCWAPALIEGMETEDLTPDELTNVVCTYFESWSDWRQTHGFDGRIGYHPDALKIAEVWGAFRKRVELPDDYLSKLREELLKMGDTPRAVDVFLTQFPLDWTPAYRL